MREIILQVLEGYDNYLGTDDSGDAIHGIPSDELEDVVQDIIDAIEEEMLEDKEAEKAVCSDFYGDDSWTTNDDPYKDLPNMVFMDEPCPKPKTMPSIYSGKRYVRKK